MLVSVPPALALAVLALAALDWRSPISAPPAGCCPGQLSSIEWWERGVFFLQQTAVSLPATWVRLQSCLAVLPRPSHPWTSPSAQLSCCVALLFYLVPALPLSALLSCFFCHHCFLLPGYLRPVSNRLSDVASQCRRCEMQAGN